MNRPTWDKIFSDFLILIRQRSLCLKYQTSAMIIKDTQILSIGYNGTLSKCEECKDYWYKYWSQNILVLPFDIWVQTDDFKKLHREWSYKHEIHAEINALNWISKNDVNDDYVLYTYYSPCDHCAKTILSYGIKTIKYLFLYPSGDKALDLLKEKGVNMIKISSQIEDLI
jgi:dCMP deaminase